MYKNQYFISNIKLSNSREFKILSFNNLNVYLHPSLNLSTAKKQSIEVLLLGYIINPLKPQEKDDDIVCNFTETCDTKESLFKEVQLLSGRFILLYKNNLDFIALTDAYSLKQLYYGFIEKDIILTSSPKMFLDFYGNDLELSALKQDFINLYEYKSDESSWFGDKCIDNRLMKVLPNHFLDIANKKVDRSPIYCEELVSEVDILEYSSTILVGSINAITRRYQVVQPLTSGWDSRTLLAASKEFKDKIQYYVFDHSIGNSRHPDVWVPQKLSARLGLNFQVIRPEELKEDFLTVYRKEHVFPRILPKTKEIQYYYFQYSDSNMVRVSGFGGEIGRCYYGYTNRVIDANMLRYFSRYLGKSEYVNHEIDYWLDDAREYCEEYSIPLLDLFYWEQRMGNWGALYPFEQDIAIDEFCPFYNKNLLLSILRIDPKKRSSPQCAFLHSLIKYLWDDALAEPINPIGFITYLRRLIGRNSVLRYYRLRTQSILQSLKIARKQ